MKEAKKHHNGLPFLSLAQHYKELVHTVRQISEAYLYEARLDDALFLLNSDVLKLIQSELASEDRVCIQTQRARILRYKGFLNNDHECFEAALEILLEAEETVKPLDDKSLLADTVDLIGQVIYSKELWHSTLETPLQRFEQGLALRREINDKRGITNSLLHIGWVYQHKTDADDGDAQRAFEHFQETYSRAEEGNYRLERAEAARHMAGIYRRKGELDKALSCHLEFLTISEEVGFKLYLPTGHVMVGISYLTKGALDEALEHCERARVLAQEIRSDWFLAESLFGIGAVKEAQNDTQAALSHYQKALTTAQSVNFKLVTELATRRIENLS